jgi:HAD superfamily hydrolase (TIGR01509 family)
MVAAAAIIFDFDGVIADSEVPANSALAESLTAIGLKTTLADCLRDYCGYNWLETQRRIETRLGAPLPDDFLENHRAHSRARFEAGFEPVAGAREFLERSAAIPRAIASSARPDYIRWALARFDLADHFGDRIHSASGSERSKPHPDVYLQAAQGLGVEPALCLAIEDSPVGARAAVAAGMSVVGLVAAGHIAEPRRHAEKLRAVGVHRIAFAFDEIKGFDVKD